MTDQKAFLRGICSNPADMAPRLVYSDWLEERGETKQAEFIRRQIAGDTYVCLSGEDADKWFKPWWGTRPYRVMGHGKNIVLSYGTPAEPEREWISIKNGFPGTICRLTMGFMNQLSIFDRWPITDVYLRDCAPVETRTFHGSVEWLVPSINLKRQGVDIDESWIFSTRNNAYARLSATLVNHGRALADLPLLQMK